MAAAVENASSSAMSGMEVENVYAKENDKTKKDTAVVAVDKASNSAAHYSPELLQLYYSRLFPFEFLYQWLSYGGDKDVFSKREFSFTIEPAPGEEIYIRYQSFAGEEPLAKAILKKRPAKIDIGAVFSHPPKDHNTVAASSSGNKFRPVQRELVFDIDLTDYDDIRRCGCTGANICGTCWGFMKMAVHVLDEGLKEDFGFERIAWFYSGRRGIHAWVCDEAARELTDEGRSAVANYFDVKLATEKNKEVHLHTPLHPMLNRAYKVLEPLFIEQVLPASGHGLMETSDQWTSLLDSLPATAAPVRDNLAAKWAKEKPSSRSSPEEKWHELKQHLAVFAKGNRSTGGNKAAKNMTTKERSRLETWPVETVFKYTYPRLDINVSKMRNHLLKSPFCVHPKTGRVCVPIHDIDSFDPFAVPTLSQLVQELDDSMDDDDGKSSSSMANWKKTSLKQYFEPFERDFLRPLCNDLRRQARDEAEQQAAVTGDF